MTCCAREACKLLGCTDSACRGTSLCADCGCVNLQRLQILRFSASPSQTSDPEVLWHGELESGASEPHEHAGPDNARRAAAPQPISNLGSHGRSCLCAGWIFDSRESGERPRRLPQEPAPGLLLRVFQYVSLYFVCLALSIPCHARAVHAHAPIPVVSHPLELVRIYGQHIPARANKAMRLVAEQVKTKGITRLILQVLPEVPDDADDIPSMLDHLMQRRGVHHVLISGRTSSSSIFWDPQVVYSSNGITADLESTWFI